MQNQLDPFTFAVHKPFMKKFVPVLLYFSIILGAFICDSVSAQERQAGQTPRDFIVHALGLDGREILDEGGIGAVSLLEQPVAITLAPFYLSTSDYLDLRNKTNKNKTWPQTVLHYDVRNVPVSGINLTSKLDRVQKVTITLGEDFAAVTSDNKTKIYDFKFNRLLTVNPQINPDGTQSDTLIFDNISLYAKAYRNMHTIRQITRNGSLRTLPIGQTSPEATTGVNKGASLDAFWIESSMSWAASAPKTKLTFTAEPGYLAVKRKNELLFRAKFSEKNYISDAYRDTLLAFAHHEWPLHPQILQALYEFSAPPKQLEILMYSPNALKGQKQTWVLTKRQHSAAAFPLPENALGVLQRQDVAPLAYVINEAAHNRALGGIETLGVLKRRFNQQIEAGEIWQAWLTGQKYSTYSGKCGTGRGSTICQTISDIEAAHMPEQPEQIQDYFTALRATGRPGLKVETIQLLEPYLDKKDTPAFVIRTLAMARAKMKTKQANAAGVAEIDAQILLKTALAKDPYDPNTYVGLAQVLAARGAFEQSWDIYDALRTLPTVQGVELKINRAELNLRKSTPGYFLGP